MKEFSDYDYTRTSIIKQLTLIELHGKDGSAVDANCQCINTKHTYILEGLCEEMVGFAKSEKEKQFYLKISELARELRQKIDAEDWTLHGVMRTVMKPTHPVSLKVECERKIIACMNAGGSESECRKSIVCS